MSTDSHETTPADWSGHSTFRWGDLAASRPANDALPAPKKEEGEKTSSLSRLLHQMVKHAGWTAIDLPFGSEQLPDAAPEELEDLRVLVEHADLQIIGGRVGLCLDARQVAGRIASAIPNVPVLIVHEVKHVIWGALRLGDEVAVAEVQGGCIAELNPGWIDAVKACRPGRTARRPARILRALLSFLDAKARVDRLERPGTRNMLLGDDEYLSALLHLDPRDYSEADELLKQFAGYPIREEATGRKTRYRQVPEGEVLSYERDRAEIARIHLRLGLWVAHRYTDRCDSMELQDLFDESVEGLLRAIELFEPERGNQFSTYAMHWIKQKIRRAIESKDRFIRIPHHVRADRTIPAAVRQRPRSLDQIDEGRLESALERQGGEPENPLSSALARERRVLLFRALRTLPLRDRLIVIRHGGLFCHRRSWTLKELGKHFGFSRERVRQIEFEAHRELGRLLADLDDSRSRKAA